MQINDAVSYMEPNSGWDHAGIVLAFNEDDSRVLVQWDEMNPSWVDAGALTVIDR